MGSNGGALTSVGCGQNRIEDASLYMPSLVQKRMEERARRYEYLM